MTITIISAIFIVSFLGVLLCVVARYLKEKDRRVAALDAQYSTEVHYREQNKLLEQAIAKERADHDRAKVLQNVTEESEWGAIPYDEWIAAETAAVANTVAKETSYTAEDVIKRAYRAAAKARGEDYLEDWLKAEVAKHKPMQVTYVEESYTLEEKINKAKVKSDKAHLACTAAWKAFMAAEAAVVEASKQIGKKRSGNKVLPSKGDVLAKRKTAWENLKKASAKDEEALQALLKLMKIKSK